MKLSLPSIPKDTSILNVARFGWGYWLMLAYIQACLILLPAHNRIVHGLISGICAGSPAILTLLWQSLQSAEKKQDRNAILGNLIAIALYFGTLLTHLISLLVSQR